jgi:type I restriction enzyme S subunit
MEEWKEYKLEEIGTIVGGATPSTKEPQNYDGNISWITPKDLSNYSGRYISRGERMITSEGYNSCSCKMLPKGSVLFSSRAPIGYVAIASNELCTNQGFKSVIPDGRFVDSTFLYYLLVYNKAMIEGLGSGTTFKEVSGNVMRNVVVKIPCLDTQKRISSILSSLDDKIEVNKQINENLEQQAQALFKSWFVDFEPFKDQPFVESELGMIPQGWKVVELGDLVEIIDNRGKTPPLESKDLYPIIDVKALTGLGRVLDYNKCSKYVNHETYTSWFRSGHPKKYDILLSTVGSLAETKLFMGGNGCIAQNVVALRNIDYSLYLYDYLNRIKSDLVAYNIGSVQPSIKITHIVKHKIIVPQAKVLERYQILSRKLTESICNYCSEIDNLSSLRDELLPKLMSGEINVNEVKL